MNKISVIIPTYNRENLLKDAILSVLNQTYKDFELIIVDDCSKDNTQRTVEKFEDDRIVYIKHKENRGVAVACNTGIKKSKGDFIFILNDDDLIVPDALEKLVEKIIKSDVKNLSGIYGWSWWINNKGKTTKITKSDKIGNILKNILARQVFTNLLIKKEVFENIGLYNENLRNNEDFDFYLRMAEKYQFDFVPKIITVVRDHNLGHLSSFSRENIVGYEEIAKKYIDNPSSDRNFIYLILPSNVYIALSKIKNYLIYQSKVFFNKEIKQQLIEARKSFLKQGIKI